MAIFLSVLLAGNQGRGQGLSSLRRRPSRFSEEELRGKAHQRLDASRAGNGYLINMLAVPLLALAGCWQAAALFIVAERAGRAIRTPVRDAILSPAAVGGGRGWVFGLHEAMDQIGAMLGPLIVFSMCTQLASLPLLFLVGKRRLAV